MSHRAAHRILAEELRDARVDMGLPADPSPRERKPHARFTCLCGREFRQPWQRRLHALLNACGRAS
jgi:hypothetical protein